MYNEVQELPLDNMRKTLDNKPEHELRVISHEEARRLQEETREKYKEAFDLLKDL